MIGNEAVASRLDRPVRRYVIRKTEVAVLPDGDPLFSEMATHVRIVNEAAGEFVEVEQHGRTDVGKICINPDEWPHLRAVIDEMIAYCVGDDSAA